MLLKSILNKVIRYVSEHPTDEGCIRIRQCVQQSNRTLDEFIYALDMREIGLLRDLVPLAFPRHLRPPVELVLFQNNLGAWRLDPKLKETVNSDDSLTTMRSQ
jgi:hypothetical protein